MEEIYNKNNDIHIVKQNIEWDVGNIENFALTNALVRLINSERLDNNGWPFPATKIKSKLIELIYPNNENPTDEKKLKAFIERYYDSILITNNDQPIRISYQFSESEPNEINAFFLKHITEKLGKSKAEKHKPQILALVEDIRNSLESVEDINKTSDAILAEIASKLSAWYRIILQDVPTYFLSRKKAYDNSEALSSIREIFYNESDDDMERCHHQLATGDIESLQQRLTELKNSFTQRLNNAITFEALPNNN